MKRLTLCHDCPVLIMSLHKPVLPLCLVLQVLTPLLDGISRLSQAVLARSRDSDMSAITIPANIETKK